MLDVFKTWRSGRLEQSHCWKGDGSAVKVKLSQSLE
jgi:hypothetical protein